MTPHKKQTTYSHYIGFKCSTLELLGDISAVQEFFGLLIYHLGTCKMQKNCGDFLSPFAHLLPLLYQVSRKATYFSSTEKLSLESFQYIE